MCFEPYLIIKHTHTHTHTPQIIYIVTRSKTVIIMNISNITDLQPSTAPLLMSMHKRKKKIAVLYKHKIPEIYLQTIE
jgi:hypothetical protein